MDIVLIGNPRSPAGCNASGLAKPALHTLVTMTKLATKVSGLTTRSPF